MNHLCKAANITKQRIVFFVLFFISLASVPTTFAADDQTKMDQATPQVSYDADLSLIYIDKLHNPIGRSDYPSSTSDAFSTNGRQSASVRSLGLARLVLGLSLDLPEESRLTLKLRPDVLNRTEDYSDFDSRAGKVYFPQSKVKFVDEYFLGLQFDTNLTLDIGVFELLTPRYLAYPALLAFGLEVRFPERFAGARINWTATKAIEDTGGDRSSSGWFSELIVLQGNEDRVETQSVQDSTQDNAPESNDAHLGVANITGYDFSDRHRLGLMVGMGRSDYIREVEESGVINKQKSKRDEVYGQVFDSLFLKFPILSTKFNVDYRIMKEKWKSSIFRIQPRTHQSASLSVATEVAPAIWVYTGFFIGRSKMQDDLTVDGYQLDLGMSFNPKKNLYFTTGVAEEHRDMERDGLKEGGFLVDGRESPVIRRFALELRYLFNKG